MPFSPLAAVPLLASLVLAYRAGPGTVYVAADSRYTGSTTSGIEAAPNDSACKIRVLNRGIVFAGTGNALFYTEDIRTSIYSVAAQAARSLPRRPLQPSDVRRVALAWQTAMHSRLLEKAATLPEGADRLRAAASLSNTGVTGSFYAATDGGGVYGITLRIAPGPDGRLRDVEEPEPPAGYLVATGTTEAKERALSMARTPPFASLAWPERLRSVEAWTIRVETQRHGRNSEVGGAVDLIEITPDGPRWLAKKASCR